MEFLSLPFAKIVEKIEDLGEEKGKFGGFFFLGDEKKRENGEGIRYLGKEKVIYLTFRGKASKVKSHSRAKAAVSRKLLI